MGSILLDTINHPLAANQNSLKINSILPQAFVFRVAWEGDVLQSLFILSPYESSTASLKPGPLKT